MQNKKKVHQIHAPTLLFLLLPAQLWILQHVQPGLAMCQPATSFEEAQWLCNEGKTSLITNLPRPNTVILLGIQNHAYVSVIACIGDTLAGGWLAHVVY